MRLTHIAVIAAGAVGITALIRGDVTMGVVFTCTAIVFAIVFLVSPRGK